MRPYKIEVILRSTTVNPEGTLDTQQEVVITEYSDDEVIHVTKNFHIGKKVNEATFEAMQELAGAAGFITSIEDAGGQGQGQGQGQGPVVR